jgi:hypothetical protein
MATNAYTNQLINLSTDESTVAQFFQEANKGHGWVTVGEHNNQRFVIQLVSHKAAN